MIKYVRNQYRQFRLHRENLLKPTSFTIVRPGVKSDWPVCSELINPEAVVYSFGVGANVAWDLGMIEQFGVHIHAFDPTPESIAWVGRQSLPAEFHFHDFGIAAFDGTLNFYPPKKPGRMHFSQDRQKYNSADQPQFAGKVLSLNTIMQRLGHARIDVLKLDVEGTEFDCVPDILQSGIKIGQLLVEVHYHYPQRSFREGLSLLRKIESAGLQCFDISARGLEFAFVSH
jgi:FkbM family methyltransferase